MSVMTSQQSVVIQFVKFSYYFYFVVHKYSYALRVTTVSCFKIKYVLLSLHASSFPTLLLKTTAQSSLNAAMRTTRLCFQEHSRSSTAMEVLGISTSVQVKQRTLKNVLFKSTLEKSLKRHDVYIADTFCFVALHATKNSLFLSFPKALDKVWRNNVLVESLHVQ